MDVPSFLKWEPSDKERTTSDSSKRLSNNTLSFVQDNLSSFFHPTTSNTSSSDSNSLSQHNDDHLAQLQPQQQQQQQQHQQQHDTTQITTNEKATKQQSQLADILVEKLLAMAIPSATDAGVATAIEGRVQAGKLRPTLSVPVMSKNFILLNSRLAQPFQLVDNVIRFFSWESPTLTLSVLMLYTHVVLKPLPLLMSFPFMFTLIYIMTPAYTSIHPPEQHTVLGRNNPVLSEGPRLRNAITNIPKPAPELSKEFILNLTDLQNHMILYVIAWDFIVGKLQRFAYYKDSAMSSFMFLTFALVGVSSLLFGDLIIQLIPWKLMLILIGWGFTLAFHPFCYDYVFNLVYSEETRYYILGKTNKLEDIIQRNFQFEEAQEQKEVEMFEIQQFNKGSKEWNLVFYLDNDFTKVAEARINYELSAKAVNGTVNKDSIKPPMDWDFLPKDSWKIDLSPEVWIKSHLLESVVRIDNETKWVYDLGEHGNNYQPQFRRRRWTRTVMRHVQSDLLEDA